jgi:L-asparaginase / beta-aspartyl-peptidase
MIHGGAGTLDHPDKDHARYLASIRVILEQGRDVLAGGGTALQAVESCACLLEDDPLFNAGCGSVLNEHGTVEMDAAIMDGRCLSAGAVAAVSNIANPVKLARLVLAHGRHVLLVGDGALEFAERCGMQPTPDAYFVTEQRLQQYLDARSKVEIAYPGDDPAGRREEEHSAGTIGAIARDAYGNLAAATSTGGVVNKHRGRVGDSPIIGAGVYADNETCAVSATGCGEDFLRTVMAKTLAGYIELQGHDAACAARAGIEYLVRKVNGRGGVIVIDSAGRCASRFNTGSMVHGWIERGGETVCTFVDEKQPRDAGS